MASAGATLTASFEGSLVKLPDFSIRLGSRVWKVHLDLLAEKSGFFANIQKNRDFKEFKEKAVTLHDDQPELFAAALQFIYYGTYSSPFAERVKYTTLVENSPYSQLGPSVLDILAGGLGCDDLTFVVTFPVGGYRHYQHEEMALAMHVLSQKYSIEALSESTSKALMRWRPANTKAIVRVFLEYIATLHVDGHHIKQILATKIAETYDEVRAEDNENAKVVYKWLANDIALALEVCDALRARDPTPKKLPNPSRSLKQIAEQPDAQRFGQTRQFRFLPRGQLTPVDMTSSQSRTVVKADR